MGKPPDQGLFATPRGIRATRDLKYGAVAQLGERVLCKHEVTGSIPVGSIIAIIHFVP